MYQNNPTKCRLGEVRLSYVHLTRPYKRDELSKPKYSVTMLLPKSNVAAKQDIDAAIAAATELGVSNKWDGKRPARVPHPVWDGDGVRSDGEPFGPECKGMWVITASTNAEDRDGNPLTPPTVVHISNVHAKLAPEDIYSGMWGYCTVNFAPYSNAGKKGVGCYLNNVCKTRDDEALGMGRSSAADEFADLEQPGAVDQMGGQPQQYQPAAPQQYTQPYQPAPQYQQYQQPAAPQQYAQPYQPAAPEINPLTGQPYNTPQQYYNPANYEGNPF